MAEPTNPPKDKGKGGGPFKNLSPKQKRYALVFGAAGLLALLYLLQRRGGASEEGQSPSVAASPEGGTMVPPTATGATDPTAFLGAQSDAINSALGTVSSSLDEVGGSLGELTTGQEGLKGEIAKNTAAERRTAAALAKQGKALTAIRQKLRGGGPGRNHRAPGGHSAPAPKPKPKAKPKVSPGRPAARPAAYKRR